MPLVFSPLPCLSGSTNGRGIKVAANASPGTTIHQVGASTSGYDEVWLWVSNSDNVPHYLTVQFGGTLNPDDHITDTLTVPAKAGPMLVIPGIRLNNALTILAFADVTNVLIITGHANRAQ